MNKQEKKQLRKSITALGLTLLLYIIIMNVCVLLISLADAIFQASFFYFGSSFDTLYNVFIDIFLDNLINNGWGYVLAIGLGLLFLRLWKGKEFVRKKLWISSREMTFGSFFFLLVLFLSGQVLFMWLSNLQELLLNLFGFSAVYSLEAATFTSDTLSMFLYAALLAPISEEILFRGLILRSLEPHGKRFAILFSAFLFGVFHGNLVQSPFAFFVGIVLGYTALEYNILWAMLLHMINNLVISDMFYRIFTPQLADIVTTILLYICAVIAVIMCIVNRKKIKSYMLDNPINNQKAGVFFSSWGMILYLIAMELSAISGLTRI